jgi:tetratricopeptide (TPR) repeat protein
VSGRALVLTAGLAAAACHSQPAVRPIAIQAEALPDYSLARALRDDAADAEGDARRGKLEAALAAARRAHAEAPDDFRIATLVQDLEFDLDPRAARELYAATGASATAREKTLAARALLPERLSDARDLLASACEQDPKFAWARYGLAFVDREFGRTDSALAGATEALRLDPTLLEALRLIAELAEEAGQRDEAVWARKELVSATGGDLEERRHYAQLLLESDAPRAASTAEKELRAIADAIGDPPPPNLRAELRDVYVDLGTAYALRERNPDALAAAIRCWRHALELDPECLTALSNIGLVELFPKRQNDSAALAAFEEYLRRAQTLSTPLSEDQVYYRQFFVPNQVLQLRQRLGLSTEPVEPILEGDRGPTHPEAGR